MSADGSRKSEIVTFPSGETYKNWSMSPDKFQNLSFELFQVEKHVKTGAKSPDGSQKSELVTFPVEKLIRIGA